jgi:hypothetical protein
VSDEYWKDKNKWDKIHGRGEYAPREVAPTPPPDPLTEAKARIARLERALSEQWEVYARNYIEDESEQRLRAFNEMTKRLQELGVTLPEHILKK